MVKGESVDLVPICPFALAMCSGELPLSWSNARAMILRGEELRDSAKAVSEAWNSSSWPLRAK